MKDIQPEIRWKNRRRLAWSSFFLIVCTALPLIALALSNDAVAARVDKIGFFLTMIYGCWVSIVLAYIGGSALVNAKLGRN